MLTILQIAKLQSLAIDTFEKKSHLEKQGL